MFENKSIISANRALQYDDLNAGENLNQIN